MANALETLETPDGRTLAWAEYGPVDGRPLVVLHGTPGSRLQAALLSDAAAERGVRVIAPERPGYGSSTRAKRLSFDLVASDLIAVLDHLGLRQAGVAGISGGAGYALAAAAKTPDRFTSVVLVGGSVPGAPRWAKRNTMRANVQIMRIVRLSPDLYRWILKRAEKRQSRPPRRRLPGLSLLSRLPRPPKLRRGPSGSPPADLAILENPAIRESLMAAATEARAQGSDGMIDDLRLCLRRRPFSLADVKAPVVLIHGTEDANVPITVARWLASEVPGSRLIEMPGRGHLFIAAEPHLLLDAMLEAPA